MSRRPATFTQADIARVMRAAEQVAPGRWRVRVSPDGEIIAEPAPAADLSPLSPADGDQKPVASAKEWRL